MNKLIISALLALTVAACAGPNPYGNSTERYGSSEANQTMQVSHGTVIDVQPVTIDSEGNVVGKIAGGLIGGIGGSSVGGGRGSAAAAVAGAVVGGMIGNKVEEMYNKANGVQITVQLDNGQVQSIVQEANVNALFRKGDHVKVVKSASSKARVIQ
ncbi:MAG: glycine zipper 2TM domain-containing protein [Cycloclasticus sp.]|nr:glycine zipper 2TM domain-containing protein [Cycloclasticus sp.]MBQ0790586.1 glycine zipper 2TM domain-containing protein [Cycloclasticus sp.]